MAGKFTESALMGAMPMNVPDFKTVIMPATVHALDEWKHEAIKSELPSSLPSCADGRTRPSRPLRRSRPASCFDGTRGAQREEARVVPPPPFTSMHACWVHAGLKNHTPHPTRSVHDAG